MQSAGGEKVKTFILKLGLIVVCALIFLIYGLLHIVNPILLSTNNFSWLIVLVLFENVLYKTWEVCTVIYLGYAVYYFVDRKRSKV